MVHALEQVHSMLHREGLLVNVHDLPVPHTIEVYSPGAAIQAGWLTDKTDFEYERLASSALARVVADGLFNLEDERIFDFNIQATDFNELKEWLADWWESAILPERTSRRVEGVFQEAREGARIVIVSPARMTKLSVA
jgi:hypothetical protein